MKYGCIGEHLKHSFSKEIHNALADYDYEIKEIPKDELDAFMVKRDFLAINVTIPYKELVIPHLYYIDEFAKEIGAVNTIVNKNGRLYGYNTDYFGMMSLIKKAKIELNGKKVLIIGTGGTSKTANAVAGDMGAEKIIFASYRKKEGAYSYEEIYSEYTDIDVIINTSPVGMYPENDGKPIEISKFTNLEGVIDAIYNPIRTNLVIEAQEKGMKAEGGLYMLVSQAIYAYEHFMDTCVDKSLCDTIYNKILNQKNSIALIGMPSSGKSTVGKLLVERTGKLLVDTDEEITRKIGMSIKDYFSLYGEKEFRKIESEVIKELSHKNSLIIATGGGAILNYDNIRRLKQNAVIYFIDRSLDNLMPTSDRPLSSDMGALKRRYDERYGIYVSSCDVRVNGDVTPKEVAEIIYGEYAK